MKFIHTSDVHLGTPFTSKPEVGEALLKGIESAFAALVDLAVREKVDFVLIAGDLLEKGSKATLHTENFLIQQLRKLDYHEIRVFVAPGNHDPCVEGSLYQQEIWPPCVHVFRAGRPETIHVECRSGDVVEIHGVAHIAGAVDDNLVQRVIGNPKECFQIALLHTAVAGAAGIDRYGTYAPCHADDFPGRGVQYWAIGHMHKRQSIIEDSTAPLYVVYPGCIQGRDFGETGPKGTLLVDVDKDWNVRLSFKTLSRYCWYDLGLSTEDVNTINELTDGLRGEIDAAAAESGGGQLCVRVTASGRSKFFRRRDEMMEAIHQELAGDARVFYYVTRDGTSPVFSPEEVATQDNILGEFVRRVLELREDRASLRDLMQDAPIAGPELLGLKEYERERRESELIELALRRGVDALMIED